MIFKFLFFVISVLFLSVSDCYAVNDPSDTSATGNGTKSLETEGYYLKYAYKELNGSGIVCDCKCHPKYCPYCPRWGSYCGCPVSKHMNGALDLFGEMGTLTSSLPKVENQIIKEDYVPFLLTRMGLMRAEDGNEAEEDAALMADLMDTELVDMIQGLLEDEEDDTEESGKTRKEKEEQTSTKIAEARQKLHDWILEQMVVPRTKDKALERLKKWNVSTEMEGMYLKAPIKFRNIEPVAAVDELTKKEYNTLKHVGMISNYAISKAYIITEKEEEGEVENGFKAAFKRVVNASTFQSKYQRLGELQLQAMTRLNESAKLSAKFAESYAIYELPSVIEKIKQKPKEDK
ncbi:MAG: hypothetical protein IJC30_03270 [Alphaproteobacteria bacterium]|nr:hypothetical protein [Alphaproteobacteria bacterium]